MGDTTRLVLLRHGQTDWNLDKRYQGQTDIGLNPTGRAQAQAAAPHIARLAPGAVVSSDLSRARDTAAAVASPLGLPVALDARLREIDVGRWSGQSVSGIAAAEPAAAAAVRRGEDVAYGGDGERPSDVARRMFDVATELDEELRGNTVLLVSHGMAIRLCVAALMGIDVAHSRALGSIGNCGWSVLSHGPGHRWRLDAYNRVAG